jgi:hypothetical protein
MNIIDEVIVFTKFYWNALGIFSIILAVHIVGTSLAYLTNKRTLIQSFLWFIPLKLLPKK